MPHTSHIRTCRHAQSGVSMIELLVAFLIFSFGMLGLAGLQSKTLSYSQSSLFRSQATALTDDILDRMRADRIQALAGGWDTDLATASGSVTPTGTGIVTTDLAAWKAEVEALLPQGKASIVTDTVEKKITVTIEWDDSRGREAAQQFVTITLL